MKRPLPSYRRLTIALVRGALLGFVFGLTFFAGFVVRGHLSESTRQNTATRFALLTEVEHLLQQYYLRDLPPAKEMEYAAIRGYLGTLNDPFTFFIDPPVAQNESEVLAGRYGGIGVQVRRNERGELVLFPFKDGPAARAGVLDGDLLLAVNGAALAPNERLDVVDRLLRGEVGDGRGVTITVRQPDQTGEREYFIEFEEVIVPSVIWRIIPEAPSLGYVQLLRFTARTPDELRTALAELTERGAQALILDLRGNSGGLLEESVAVASEFLDGGVVFYERTRAGEKEALATPGGAAITQPLAVLVDQSTASAAELVAGAIRDRGRGILIGQKTYGKGSVQLIFRLADESSIHITAAEWFTPAHMALDGQGLQPDIAMIPAEDGRDVELAEAIRHLSAQLASVSSSAPN
jgi:carboxyl-terminal processing protease